MPEPSKYGLRFGVSATKEEVHAAIKILIKVYIPMLSVKFYPRIWRATPATAYQPDACR